MATKKTAAKKSSAKKAAMKKAPKNSTTEAHAATPDAPHSMPKAGRDPKGGLTAKGREYFNQKEGSHLRPGVQGPADTPEKMVRKGSFLRRHFTHPRGPMKDPKGEPTRLALSAHAWGEPVPNTSADAKKLANKGHQLLEQYHAIKDGDAPESKRKLPAKRSVAAKKTSAKKLAAKSPAAKKTSSKKAAAN